VLRYTDHYARSGGRPSKKESLVALFDNVSNMTKSMVGFSKNPAILFAMFCRGSIGDPSGVDMAPMPVCVSRP
jgi:hypothetical protein